MYEAYEASWYAELEPDIAQPITPGSGKPLTPDSVEWRAGVHIHGPGDAGFDREVTFHRRGPFGVVMLRPEEVPDWVPRPPDGWDQHAADLVAKHDAIASIRRAAQ